MVEFTVGTMEAGKKVHRLVRQLLPGVPLSGIHKMIRTGRVKRNGRKAKPDDVLILGDTISLYMASSDYDVVRKSTAKYGGVSREVALVYEDDLCLAANKPSGLLTHGDVTEQKDTLVNRVLAVLQDRGELDDSPFRPAPVNRLDRNTSGIVLFGKTAAATRQMAEDIQTGSIRKWYVAIVRGETPASGVIDASLDRDSNANRTLIRKAGKAALTRYETIARTAATSVVRVELVTGRTHQIRAHFAHLGLPLWGDVKYGDGEATGRSHDSKPHQWLHAVRLRLTDGTHIDAPLPAAYVQTLRGLGYSGGQIAAIVTYADGQA